MSERAKATGYKFDNLVHLLETRAADQPDRLAYTFLRDGEVEEAHLSYGELARKARAVGAWLQERSLQNRNVLLLYPPGLEYIVAFWGCLYAGAVAVPAYPPRRNRHIDRLQTIAADAQPQVALTTSSIHTRLESSLTEAPALRELTWGVTEKIDEQLADGWRVPQVDHTTLAFLQYTSGSTATPKGVMVTHGGVLHNEELIRHAFHQSEHSVIVGWLPLYHDMGLIGNVLQPLYLGARCILMSPLAFLQQPARWLDVISRYRGTTSGGPNFAYDLCLRKISEEERHSFDLSCWDVAFNGAEPVRAETLQRFAEFFGPCGFDRKAFYPCYGLAEATLFVSGWRMTAEPAINTVRRTALESGFALDAEEHDSVSLVGCGASQSEPHIVIANPESLATCKAGEVGEVWISGQSVAAGYWNRPEETANVFHAYLSDTGAGPYLRSGDLGFFDGQELFITGRIKDLIIIRGRNLYPHDLERTVEKSHPSLRPGAGVAFSIQHDHEERLVIVQEVGRHVSPAYDEVIGNIRQTLAEEHEVQPYCIALVAVGNVPKTSSGKTQRSACREMFLGSTLEVLHAWYANEDERASDAVLAEGSVEGLDELVSHLRAQLASKLSVDIATIDVHEPLTRCGLDSLAAIEMAHAIESEFNVEWSMASLLEGPSLFELATQLRVAIAGPAKPGGLSIATSGTHALSHGQQALWFLHRLNPDSAAYNVAAAARVNDVLDAAALKNAFKALAQRHAALRTTFESHEGRPVQRVHDDLPVQFVETDASFLSQATFDEWLDEEAFRPFDLEAGPLWRVNLFKRPNDEYVLLIVAHHIVVDFWSLSVMWQEVGELYSAQRQGRPAMLSRVQSQYADYVRKQDELLQGPEGEGLWNYWQSQLGPGISPLNLPSDRPRPPVQSHRGTAYSFTLDPALTRRLKELALDEGATLYATLLAAFQTLLYRYTGQESFAVGSPSTGRDSAVLTNLVGYFVNPLVMRADFSGDPSFVGLLARVRRTVLDALSHQAFPFALLVQRLQPERDPSRTPLFETMFTFQPSQLLKGEALSSFAVGETGLRVKAGELVLESLALPHRAALFDLMLSMTEVDETLLGSVEYNTDLFDYATIRRMVGHFETVLESIVEAPLQRVSELELLTPAEQCELIVYWNETARQYDGPAGMHEFFEAQVARTPRATALVYNNERLSYEELNERANQLAHYLRALGVGPETLVGVLLDRSPMMIVAMLGVLKSGGAYVPLDSTYPRERLQFTLQDARVHVLLTQEATLLECGGPAPLWAGSSGCDTKAAPGRRTPKRSVVYLDTQWTAIARSCGDNPEQPVADNALAYVIYTSGSTGRPKGVAIEHRSAVAFIHWAKEVFSREHLAGVLASTSICFDLSIFEIFVPLSAGGTIILAGNALELPSLAAAHEVTLVNTVPSAMTELVRLNGVPESVRVVNLAGEPLQNALVQSVYAREHVEQVLNLYGPSEDTTYSTWTLVEKGSAEAPTIGRPVANTQAYLLDAHLQLVPVGVPGELYLGGFGLARGYLNVPELTAERFVPDPFSATRGARMYRTGDLARYLADGRLEYLGRLDHQLKLRGFRIELGEIEAVLKENRTVEDAVVVAREDRLVAYVVSRANCCASKELRDYLKQKLPHYMIPAAFVVMDKLPLTPNGKIDRRLLPAPLLEMESVFIAPRDQIEEVIAGVWSLVLGVEQVGIHANFFDLGGHSLLATQVIARVNETFHVDLPLRCFFESPTVEAISDRVKATIQAGGAHEFHPIERVTRDGPLPLSFAQQRLWFLDQLEPGSAAYHVPILIRLTGPLNAPALEQSIRAIINRHESLRTTFKNVGERPAQVITAHDSWHLDAIDVTEVEEAEREALRHARQEALLPFDLSTGPLLRATLWRVSDDTHILLLTMHHIVADGWSIGIFVSELSALYNAISEGRSSPLAELPCQYADFAQWQRQRLTGELLAEQLNYWKQRLSDPLKPIELPSARVRPTSNDVSAATAQREFPEQLRAGLHRLSRERGVTTFMTLLAAFQTLLHRYTGLDDIVVGTPVANRTRIETESLIGFFANTLVLRGDVSGDPSFDEWLARVRTLTLEAHAHQDVPFEVVVEELQPERDLNRTPFFQIMLVMQNTPPPVIDLPGVRVEQLELGNTAPKFDLILFLNETDGKLKASWEYNPARFDAETIAGMASHFETLLESAIADPRQRVSQLKMLPDDERERVVSEWNETAVEYPHELGMHELFEAQVARTPRATALVYNNERLSYEELNERANQLAHYLRALGVGPEKLVGVLLDRSPMMIVAMLGVLKSGGAYVPLDSTYPRERLQFTLQDARVHVLLTQEATLLECGGPAPLWAGSSGCDTKAAPGRRTPKRSVVYLDTQWTAIARSCGDNPEQPVADNALAYVIYTSGSTGRPKGVAIEHRSAVAFIHWAKEVFSREHLAGVLASTSICFDLSVFEIFAPLSVGGKIILATNALELPSLAGASEVTLVNTVPSAMTELVRLNGVPESVRVVNLAGEPLQNALVQSIYAREHVAQVLNLYGPSEDTTYSTWTMVEKGSAEAPTIGRPVANTQAYLLDAHLQLVPVGVPGELYLGGFGLARGYLNVPESTAERFVPDPFSATAGARMYRTGDLARYLADGRLEYLGRLDHQLKLRGFRIELGEIETVLRENAVVRDAVVVAHETQNGDKQLAAYVVSANGQAPTTKELRAYLHERLPKYMVPSYFIALEELPLTPNGKVDRRALPALSESAQEPTATDVEPRTQVEKELATIWEQLLDRKRISVNENFFELGGHSLLATQVISRVREMLKVEIPLRSIFEASTIAELAERIERSLGSAPRLPISRAPRDTALPLSFAQQRLWFIDQVVPGNPAYNIQAAVQLSGPLNVAALGSTLNEIVQRHEILRTTFHLADGQPSQVISAVPELPLEVRDLSKVPAQEQAVQQLASEEARVPFDLTQWPLMRAVLLRLADTEHVLLLSVHHIVADGWSMGVLVQEVATLYPAFVDGTPVPLAELPIQYANFAMWQRQWLQGDVLHEQLDYWRQQLAGVTPLQLATDYPRPVEQSYRGARRFFSLPADISNELRALSRREGVTLYMTLLAAWQTLLHRYTGQSDIVAGTDIANRNHHEIEGLIGFFTNQLVLRADFSGNPTFKELLRRVRETTLGAYAHQDLPFEKVVEALQLERALDRNPLFQVMFVFQNTPMQDLELPGLSVRTLDIDEGTTAFDLTLTMAETAEGIKGSMRYSTDLFKPATIQRMVRHFENILRSIVGSVETPVQALEMYDAEEVVKQKERAASRLTKLMSVKPRAVTFSGEALFKTCYLQPDQRLPLVIESSFAEVDLAAWARRHEEMIEAELLRHGAILFRGFNVNSLRAFDEFTRAVSHELVEYGERSSPRTQLRPGIYTSTDHPPDQHIVLHNEQSYTLNWPMKIVFCCQQPAEQGGRTPIADSREIYRCIDPPLVELFEKKSVMYVRNYGDGLGLPWQEVFQTTVRAEVEEHCYRAAIVCEWKDGDRLCTRQVRPAVRTHPKTGEWVWFNHALFFHVSSLDAETRAAFGALSADELPFNTLFGDGTPIDISLMEEIREAYTRATVSFPWQMGDVLMLDNMLAAHGREPFAGPRKVVVAMADPFQDIYQPTEMRAAAQVFV